MLHVKIKRFLDSEQIQIHDKICRADKVEDELTHAYLYTKTNMK